MSWLRMQGRGALVVLTGWAGLAAAQVPQMPAVPNSGQPSVILEVQAPDKQPTPPAITKPASTTAPKSGSTKTIERIVTVNENGKTIRCRIVETWQLANGTMAHKLQAIESGEYMTIIDDPAGASPNSKGAAKQIFHWGLKNRTPPAGVPAPPVPTDLYSNSGVVRTQDTSAQKGSGPSPYAVSQGVKAGSSPNSPYNFADVSKLASGPCTSCTPYACNACTPCQTNLMPTAGITTPPVPQGTIVAESPTLRERIQSWFSSKTPADQKTVVVPAEKKAKPQEKVLAIADPPSSAQQAGPEIVAPPTKQDKLVANSGPPSSAQPARTEIVAPPTKDEVAKSWSKDASVGMPSKFAVVADAKPDVLTSPEKLPKAQGKAVAQDSTCVPGTPTTLPPGAESVLAARCGLNGPIAFIPVQTPVVPQPWRAPVPPEARVPEAPMLNAYVNAFTPPAPPRGGNGPQVYNPMPMMANNNMTPYGMQQYGMMPYGMNPYVVMTPYGPQAAPYGYPIMQTGYPMMQGPMGPRGYQGPVPPNPFGTPAQPHLMQQVSYPPMAAPAPVSPGVQTAQWIDTLRDAAGPAQREMAAVNLMTCDWRANPHVVAALVYAAGEDPAPAVRAGCVQCLMQMNVRTEAVANVLQALRTDPDPRVRDAAEQAIVRIR